MDTINNRRVGVIISAKTSNKMGSIKAVFLVWKWFCVGWFSFSSLLTLNIPVVDNFFNLDSPIVEVIWIIIGTAFGITYAWRLVFKEFIRSSKEWNDLKEDSREFNEFKKWKKKSRDSKS